MWLCVLATRIEYVLLTRAELKLHIPRALDYRISALVHGHVKPSLMLLLVHQATSHFLHI